MNLPFSFRQKVKIAAFLFGIMACTLLIRILEDKSIAKMDVAFSSMYNDRLVPAIDLFQISEQVYAKRHLMESFEANESNNYDVDFLRKKLAYFDGKIDSLLSKYEKTYLVSSEKQELMILKTELQTVKGQEQLLVSTNHSSSFSYQAYDRVAAHIANLTKIQSKVGDELSKSSQEIISGSKLYATIQLILAILIGVLIVSILFTSQILKVKPSDFNLN